MLRALGAIKVCMPKFVGWSNHHFNNLPFRSSVETSAMITCFKRNADPAAE